MFRIKHDVTKLLTLFQLKRTRPLDCEWQVVGIGDRTTWSEVDVGTEQTAKGYSQEETRRHPTQALSCRFPPPPVV